MNIKGFFKAVASIGSGAALGAMAGVIILGVVTGGLGFGGLALAAFAGGGALLGAGGGVVHAATRPSESEMQMRRLYSRS
ncbi:MAG: hypothetical protein CMH30_02910 [Micavibrio sp.]|nr:hypothetical protein [Micavibrio sp.]